jgi:hypothetical protein
MNFQPGEKMLISAAAWFFAPDGRQYRAVWGTVRGVHSDSETLGIRTNARSANWYVEVGDTIIAGCQVMYAVRCAEPPPARVQDEHVDAGKVIQFERSSNCWNADGARAA